MNKIISLFGLKLMAKNNAVAATQIAGPDKSPDQYFVAAQCDLVTETIKICRERKKKRAFEELRVALMPKLKDNLVTRATVEWIGREDNIYHREPSFSSPVPENAVALTAIGFVDLSVNFHRAGNERKTWHVTFVVVEELWAGIGLILGEEMCNKAKIVRGDQLCPFTIKKISEEQRRQEEEDDKKAQERAEVQMAAEDRERLSKERKKAEAAGDQSKKV